ncbi:MAG: hypothetical protein ACXV5C_11465 [Halobacteriota archaeon]
MGASIWKLIQTPRTVREARGVLLEGCEAEADRAKRTLSTL